MKLKQIVWQMFWRILEVEIDERKIPIRSYDNLRNCSNLHFTYNNYS